MNHIRLADKLLPTIESHLANRQTGRAIEAIQKVLDEAACAAIRDQLGTDERGELFDLGSVRGMCGAWKTRMHHVPIAESAPLAIVMSASPGSTPIEAWTNEVFTLASFIHRHISAALPRGDGLLETWGLTDDVCDALGMIAAKARAAHLLMSQAMWDARGDDDDLDEEDRRSRSQAPKRRTETEED